MLTDDLIRLLSQSPPAKPPLGFAAALAAISGAAAMLSVGFLGPRAELASLAPPASMLLKTLLLAALAAVGTLAAKRLASPLPKALPKASILGVGILFAAVLGHEWLTKPAAAILHPFTLANFPFCLGSVSLFGAAGAAAMLALMRFHAPASLARAGTAVGFAAAAAGGLGYSLHCPIDGPSFVGVAYGLPILAVTLAARWWGARFLRW